MKDNLSSFLVVVPGSQGVQDPHSVSEQARAGYQASRTGHSEG